MSNNALIYTCMWDVEAEVGTHIAEELLHAIASDNIFIELTTSTSETENFVAWRRELGLTIEADEECDVTNFSGTSHQPRDSITAEQAKRNLGNPPEWARAA